MAKEAKKRLKRAKPEAVPPADRRRVLVEINVDLATGDLIDTPAEAMQSESAQAILPWVVGGIGRVDAAKQAGGGTVSVSATLEYEGGSFPLGVAEQVRTWVCEAVPRTVTESVTQSTSFINDFGVCSFKIVYSNKSAILEENSSSPSKTSSEPVSEGLEDSKKDEVKPSQELEGRLDALFAALPEGQFDEIYANLEELNDLFKRRMAAQLQPALNTQISKIKQSRYEDKQNAVSWVNAAIQRLGLSIRLTIEENIDGQVIKKIYPAILAAQPYKSEGRFRFQYRGDDNIRHRSGSEETIPNLEFMEAPIRVEPSHLSELLDPKPRARGRD